MPSSIVAAFAYLSAAYEASAVFAFAVNMVASSIVARVFSPDRSTNNATATRDPGARITAPPAGDNKLPVIYGTAYTGGTLIDMSITTNNQIIYYVIALSEVTNTETGGTPDIFTFGNVYWGGKKVVFDSVDLTKVIGLKDESTGLTDTTVAGKMNFYFYRNGSNNPVNTLSSAVAIMSASDLVYKWDATKQMSNCVFAIIRLQYSQTANVRGLDKVLFQVTNSRTKPGDCLSDYLQSSRYGAAISSVNINATSLAALNTYSDGLITYTIPFVGTYTKTRFRFNGVLDTSQPIMTNLQLMANSCDTLIKYNEITGQWGVIVQSPTYSVAMALNDSNIISALTITPVDISNTFNIAEVKFPDGSNQDAFNSATFDLAVIDPTLLFPNEPVNKQQITLQFVNDSVRAQLLANRFLKSCREDLQVQVKINYVGLQLEAGDIVTITNTNYGWSSKLFRIAKIVEEFGSDGSITASLSLMEYNPSVFDDASITEFEPSPNTGLADPLVFGTVPAPVITGANPSAVNPSFQVNVTASSAGIIQYAEIWYSAYSNPTDAQRIFAGTTAVQADGNPYTPGSAMPPVTLTGISAGNWYFFTRMVNELGTSVYSSASSLFQWRPTTFTYAEKYLIVAYGDSLTGTNLSASPIGKNYYGLYNSASSSFSTNPTDYTWYLAQPTFGSANKLCYINRTGRTFSFGTAPAAYAASTAAYVPASTFDASLWSALPDGTNYIDLDVRTGQLLTTGTTSVGGGELAIVNNPNGTLVGQLKQFLDFGGASTYTSAVSQLTIDIYGRVVGLSPPDGFYYTSWEISATAGQTVFTPPTRDAAYITGQDWIFRNGILLTPTSDYTENAATFTLNSGCVAGDKITCISFRCNSATIVYENLGLLYSSGAGTNTVTYTNLPMQQINAGDKITFANSGSPTQYTVASINYSSKQITFTSSFTASAGNSLYRYRALNSSYPAFSRWDVSLSSSASYTPTNFGLNSGSEVLFLNGTIVNDQDYDLVSNTINNFPSVATGNLTIIQFAPNNFGVPAGTQSLVSTYTVSGQSLYAYSYDADSFELYENGCIAVAGSDYTTATGVYLLSPTPTNNITVLSQQTFARTGAA